jgi:hypothetical protein
MLVAAVVSLGIRQQIAAPPVLVAAGFAAVAGLVVGVGVPDLGVRLSATRLHYALVGLPVGSALVLGGWSLLGRGLTASAIVPILVVVVASIPAGIVAIAADNARVRAVRDSSTTAVRWRATPPPSFARRWKLVYAGGGLALIGTGLALTFSTDTDGTFLMAFGGGILGQSLNVDRTQEFEVYERGIVVAPPGALRAHLLEWERIEAYSLTDEALTLHRWLLGFSLASDRREIDDVDAVTAALDSHLDRRSD